MRLTRPFGLPDGRVGGAPPPVAFVRPRASLGPVSLAPRSSSDHVSWSDVVVVNEGNGMVRCRGRASARRVTAKKGTETAVKVARIRPCGCRPCPAYKPSDGHMRGREIPGSWPDPVPILSRSWRVSRQPFEFGLVGPSRPPHTPHHQCQQGDRCERCSNGSSGLFLRDLKPGRFQRFQIAPLNSPRGDGQRALGGVMIGWRWIHTPSSCQRWCHRQQVVDAPYSLGILCQAQVWWRTQRMPSRLLRMLAWVRAL